MTLSPPQLCLTAHRTSIFFIGCFRCWTKQLQTHARTSARCIMGTIYQSHHALQALNTATVFCASLFFAAIFLTSFSLSWRLLCWCSCLFLMPVKKSGWGWKWWEEQVCCLSDKFALTGAQCTSVNKNNLPRTGLHRRDRQCSHAATGWSLFKDTYNQITE